MTSTAARYYVSLKDQNGLYVAQFDDWAHLAIYRRVNEPGSCSFVIFYDDPRVELFNFDCQIEVMRCVPSHGIHWYIEFEGLVRRIQKEYDESGKSFLRIYCIGYLDLLSRRIIAYKSGDAHVTKDDFAEQVIKEYVAENAGEDALVDNGRLLDGVFSQLSIEALHSPVLGSNWKGSKAYTNLLKTLQDITESVGDIDFNIVGTGACLFEFRTYSPQLGTDRTYTGVNPLTGLNPAGNSPVVFSVETGNMGDPTYLYDRTSEANIIIVGGRGVEDERDVVIQRDEDLIDDTPLNSCEGMRDARNQSEDALEDVGNEELEDRGGFKEFEFSVLNIQSCYYGVHYFLGDMVTAKFGSVMFDSKISLVDITVDGGPEVINIRIGDKKYDR